ncbi:MAG: class I SAM-dependent methyltransferase [Deltaproteobacteria bacterium]|nr:MAG: class I SAM-dependent methyltransferase [Deltaproteobacteria bacterium]
MGQPHVEREAYRDFYSRDANLPAEAGAFVARFEREQMSPHGHGGTTKGYVRGLAVRALLDAADRLGRPRDQIHVIDTGCGSGKLSVYLALQGFRVTGVDVSESATRVSGELAEALGVSERASFLTESLESLSLPDDSVDFVIGHGALHHFIKYEGVPSELLRVLRPGGEGFFADAFGENRAYHLFHDREKMERLGDVILTRQLIFDYFADFEVELVPAGWFTMLDKLYGQVLPKAARPAVRAMSRVHHRVDRLIEGTGKGLRLAGSVVTHIRAPG